MSNALAIAASGLKAQESYIDSIASDLANLNTPNYKANQLIFEDVLYQNTNGANAQSAKLGLGTAILGSTKHFTMGPLKPSSNPNDVAINGTGFYQVQNNDGTIAYTRNSSLSVDEDRYLTTQNGLRLADNIQVPDDYTQLIVKTNGDVEVMQGDELEPQLLGTIQLAKFINPDRLNPLGSGLYAPSDSSGEALIDNPGNNGLGSLAQGQIEGSNVDMVNALMQLTMAQRIYQLNAKAVQIADELEKMTNEIRN